MVENKHAAFREMLNTITLLVGHARGPNRIKRQLSNWAEEVSRKTDLGAAEDIEAAIRALLVLAYANGAFGLTTEMADHGDRLLVADDRGGLFAAMSAIQIIIALCDSDLRDRMMAAFERENDALKLRFIKILAMKP